MRKFLLVVVGVVALGLTLRFTLHKTTTKPQSQVPPPRSHQPAPAHNPDDQPSPPEVAPTAVERAPEPSRIAGTVRISDETLPYYGVGPGALYYCDNHAFMRQPKTGGPAEQVAECEAPVLDVVADTEGVFWCDGDKVMRLTPGTTGAHVVAAMECIIEALDERYVYYARPGFEGVEDPGVYRVERGGGTPERIHQRAKEQFNVRVDADAVWISGYFLGTITKLAKAAGARPQPLLSGQKNLEALGIDATYLYWAVEDKAELRRRKKAGGPIEVVAHNVMSYPVEVVDGHVYWFQRADEAWQLMHLAPGVQDAEVLATKLTTPSMRADAEGVYVTELDRPGVFMFKR